MTVSSATNSVSYIGNGVQIEYAFPFRVLEEEHLVVTVDGVQTTEWSGIGYGDDNGGSIFFNVAPADGAEILIARLVPIAQEIDYVPYDPFPAETHELGLDYGIMIDQQQQEQVDRALKTPPGSGEDLVMDLPPSGERGYAVLHFDEAGLVIRADYEIGNYIGYWATATAYRARATFSDPATENLFVVLTDHTSTDLVSDEAAGYIHKAMDFATTVQKRDEAVQAAANAATSEANALASEQAAAISETNADESEENAYQWAQADRNVPVDDGVHPSGFSSYHWSKEAEDFVNQGGAVVVSRTIVNSTGNFVNDLNATDFTGDQYADGVVTTALDVTTNMSVSFVYDGVQYVYQGAKPVLIGLGGATLTAGDFGQNSAVSAAGVSYDPTSSSLTDTNVQGAIDSLDAQVETNEADIVVLDAAVSALVDEDGRWDINFLNGSLTLAKVDGAAPLYSVTGDSTVVLPADTGVDVGEVFSFVCLNQTVSTLTFDEATNAQSIVVADDKAKTYRGTGSIITITYFGSNTWLLYGDLADA